MRTEVEYDAQAAIELEMIAYSKRAESGEYPFSVLQQDGMRTIKLEELLRSVISEVRKRTSPATVSARFHNTVARMISCLCSTISGETGLKQVVLSGGVFQNRLLLRKTISRLHEDGLEVLTHRRIPCNDGGISLGQAVVAAARSRDV
jgi:hydrogenase maturation protein HypF